VKDTWLANIEKRLAHLGADDATIMVFVAMWEEMDDDDRTRFRASSDRRLMRAIGAVREMQSRPDTRMFGDELESAATGIERVGIEAPLGTEAEITAEDLELNDASVVVATSTIPEVLAWVGDDPSRARSALEAEQALDEGARPSLVKRLGKLAEF
jgi:hypothetical protein